jgi:hypothetical protein
LGGIVCWSVFLVALLCLSACSHNKNLPPPPKPFPPQAEIPPLVLGPGDVLDIKFRYADELNDNQTVRPDGKITLQMVDEVQAAGLTPLELDAKLTELYSKYLKDPVISVVVRELVSQRVYVGGEVNKPGEVLLAGQLTALQAIMASGGFDKVSAERQRPGHPSPPGATLCHQTGFVRSVENRRGGTVLSDGQGHCVRSENEDRRGQSVGGQVHQPSDSAGFHLFERPQRQIHNRLHPAQLRGTLKFVKGLPLRMEAEGLSLFFKG